MTFVLQPCTIAGGRPTVDHHYLPQFYLKRWCGTDGKLVSYMWDERKQAASDRRVAPRKTAAKANLYTVGKNADQTLETKEFGAMDREAADAHRVLLTIGASKLTAKSRTGWAVFLASLLYRHEEDVLERDRMAPDVADRALSEWIGSYPDPEDRKSLLEGMAHVDRVQMAKDVHRGMIVKASREPELIASLVERQWLVVRCSTRWFITTDRPVMVKHGARGSPSQMLSMPLSPLALFMAYPRAWDHGEAGDRTAAIEGLVKIHNAMILSKKCARVYTHERIKNEAGRLAIEETLKNAFESRGQGT